MVLGLFHREYLRHYERLSALVGAIRTARAVRALQRATLALNVNGREFVIDGGILRAAGGRSLPIDPDDHPDEPKLIASWLARNRARVRMIDCDGSFEM